MKIIPNTLCSASSTLLMNNYNCAIRTIIQLKFAYYKNGSMLLNEFENSFLIALVSRYKPSYIWALLRGIILVRRTVLPILYGLVPSQVIYLVTSYKPTVPFMQQFQFFLLPNITIVPWKKGTSEISYSNSSTLIRSPNKYKLINIAEMQLCYMPL